MRNMAPSLKPAFAWRLWILAAIFALFPILLSCGENPVHAGGGVGAETGNALTRGTLTDAAGEPIAGLEILFVPREHRPYADDPARIRRTTTDRGGRFQLRLAKSTVWNLIARTGTDANAVGIFLPLDTLRSDSLSVGLQKLRRLGEMRIRLGESGTAGSVQAGLLGTPYWTTDVVSVYGFDYLLLPSLPPNPAYVLEVRPGSSSSVLPTASVAVEPGQDTQVELHRNSLRVERRIVLELDDSFPLEGARGGLAAYPLLVRLDSTILPAGLRTPAEEGLRLIGRDGIPTPFLVESWDVVKRQATLWVQVDILLPMTEQTVARLVWDAPHPPSSPIEAPFGSPFENPDLYRGVWQFSEAASSTPGMRVFHDASSWGNHCRDSESATVTEGVAGMALSLDGNKDFLDCGDSPSLDPDSAYSLTAWVRLSETPDSAYYRVITKKRDFNDPLGFDLEMALHTTGPGFLTLYGEGARLKRFQGPRWNMDWHHVAAVTQGDSVRLYVDGLQVHAPGNYRRAQPSPGVPLRIGSLERRDFFPGELDEVRVLGHDVPPAWIRLDYLTQHPESEAVKVR